MNRDIPIVLIGTSAMKLMADLKEPRVKTAVGHKCQHFGGAPGYKKGHEDQKERN
jgi:hypothetical protein